MKLKHSILVYINLFFHLFLFWHKLDVPNTRAHIHIWKVDLYLQDWLNGELDRVDKLKTDLFLGEQWLTQMHAAAAKQYNSIQYCMANPRHVMQALTLPWVTQVQTIPY